MTDVEVGRVLVADDDPVTRRLLERHLTMAGLAVILAEDGQQAIDRLEESVAVAIVDLQMPRRSGMDCLKHVRQTLPDCQTLVISQFGEIRDAVEAMKQGAFDYVTKPVEPEELLAKIRQAMSRHVLTRENRQLRQAVGAAMPTSDPVARSSAARDLESRVAKVAPLDATVLITGESGAGKTTLARRIHQASLRRDGPFVTVSCASLPRDLIEAELFGHARGAFTGAVGDRPGRIEMAHGGTLFLDEIGDLPLELQPKLLSFLQDRDVRRIGDSRIRKVDVRVISATHQDLETKVRDRSFREDLYFRLNVLPLYALPLRERREDIPEFTERILARISRDRSCPAFVVTDAARQALVEYAWPGNVRELENVLERASAFCSEGTVDVEDLALRPVRSAEKSTAPLAGRTLAQIERQALLETLEVCGGNKKAAARMLGVDEKTVHNKLKRLDSKSDGFDATTSAR